VSPKDIVKFFDPNIKQIYIIDDICGKFSVDQSMIFLTIKELFLKQIALGNFIFSLKFSKWA
jgi:hypothetical protein